MNPSRSRPNPFHKLAQLVSVFISLVLFMAPLCAQQPGAPIKAPARATTANKPSDAEFEKLLSDDSYKIYGEVRNVGQLLSTGGAGDIVDPIMKLADPPKEFTSLIKFLNANAEMLAGSRLMFATWPAKAGIPNAFVAIELSSAEDAAKFEPKLNRLLPILLPTPTPTPVATPTPTPAATPIPNATPGPETVPPVRRSVKMISEPPPPAGPPFVVTRSGSLVFVTDKPFKFEQLRPKGSKLLSEAQNFRLARDRFSSEPVFIYVDLALVDQTRPKPPTKEEIAQEQERIQKEEEAALAGETKNAETMPAVPEEMGPPEPEILPANPNETPTPTVRVEVQQSTAVLGTVSVEATPTPAPSKSQQAQMAASSQFGLLIEMLAHGEPQWPEAIGLAISEESEEYITRAILIGPQSGKRLIVPFVPQLIAGRTYLPNAPSVLPADTEMFVSGSFDLSQSYEEMLAQLIAMNKERQAQMQKLPAAVRGENDGQPYDPFAAFEKAGGFKIKDELLPALGNEIAVAASLKGLGALGLELEPRTAPSPAASPDPAKADQIKAEKLREEQSAPMVLIAVRDREAARKLMPKVLDGLGVGEANLIAQTQRRDDTELVNFADAFAYAFVGDFLIISTTPTVKHVVDSYLNHETLSSNSAFRSSTHWQPRDMIGQIYVSPSLMEQYAKAIHDPKESMPASMRDFLMRLNATPQAITYALSSEGSNSVHELHVPKALVIASVAGAASVSKEPPPEMNEQIAMSMLRSINSAEATYQTTEGNGSYGSLDQLARTNMISKDMLDKYGYKFEVNASGNQFEATATPVEYGKTGRRSFYIDQTGVLRGDDHAGGPANVADKPAQ